MCTHQRATRLKAIRGVAKAAASALVVLFALTDAAWARVVELAAVDAGTYPAAGADGAPAEANDATLPEAGWVPGARRDLLWLVTLGFGGGTGGTSAAPAEGTAPHRSIATSQARMDVTATRYVLPWLALEGRVSVMGTQRLLARSDDRDRFSARQGTVGARVALPMAVSPVVAVQAGVRQSSTVAHFDRDGKPVGDEEHGAAVRSSALSMALGAEAGVELAVEHLVLGAFGYAQGAAFGGAITATDPLAEAESLATGLSFRVGGRF